jgi:hypothetical protein
MAKLDDYEFRRQPQDLIDFKDDVRFLLNHGKAQFQFIVSSTAPGFAGNAGELAFVRNGTAGTLYCYSGYAWDAVALYTATTG